MPGTIKAPTLVRGGWRLSRPPDVPFQLNQESEQAAGLVAWWPFVTPRLLGSGRNKIEMINSGAQFSITNERPSYLFNDASNEFISYASAPVTAIPLTLTCWFRTDDTAINQGMVWLGDPTVAAQQIGMYFRGSDATKSVAALHWTDTPVAQAYATKTATVNQWHFACAVFLNASSRTAYIDGGFPGSETTSINASSITRTAIGMFRDLTPSAPFSGNLADVRIYNRALNSTEVYRIFEVSTRWELYQPLAPPRYWSFPAPPAPAPVLNTDITFLYKKILRR